MHWRWRSPSPRPASGITTPPPTSRWFAVGNAARNGLAAALAAQQGFTSDLKLVDGNFLSGIYGVTPDVAALTDGLGERVALAEVSFKPWCAARQTMAATQALKEIIASGDRARGDQRDRGFRAAAASQDDRSRRQRRRPGIAPHQPAILHGGGRAGAGPGIRRPGSRRRSRRRPFAASWTRIKVEADEGLLADYPRTWPARVRVTAGSERHERLVTHVPGDPARPFDRAQRAGEIYALRRTGARSGQGRAHPRALQRGVRER